MLDPWPLRHAGGHDGAARGLGRLDDDEAIGTELQRLAVVVDGIGSLDESASSRGTVWTGS